MRMHPYMRARGTVAALALLWLTGCVAGSQNSLNSDFAGTGFGVTVRWKFANDTQTSTNR